MRIAAQEGRRSSNEAWEDLDGTMDPRGPNTLMEWERPLRHNEVAQPHSSLETRGTRNRSDSKTGGRQDNRQEEQEE